LTKDINALEKPCKKGNFVRRMAVSSTQIVIGNSTENDDKKIHHVITSPQTIKNDDYTNFLDALAQTPTGLTPGRFNLTFAV
jgi:hypothetical protein